MMVQAAGRAEDMMGKYQKRNSGRTELKKDWLNRARTIQREIWALEDTEETALETATGITARYQSGTGGGGSKDPHKIEGYAILTAYIEGRRRELKALKEEILKAIETLNNADMRSICIHRYLNCREWPEISARLHISERHVHRLHGEALQLIRIDSQALSKMGKWAQKNEQIIKS